MKKRPIRVEGEIAYVPLADGTEATIDAEDAELVGQYNWCLTGGGYVGTSLHLGNGEYRTLRLHRLLMGDPEDKLVDHKNRSTRDNRRENLRISTGSQNQYNQGIPANNTSGHKGVTWDKAHKKWRAQIQHEGKKIHLGLFTDIEEASKAYREAALKYHKEFANFGEAT